MSRDDAHILLVEDDKGQSLLIRHAFRSRGPRFRLTIVHSVEEALAQIAASPPDLIITDLLLPDGSGTELLPDDPERPDFPVVMMTSYGDEHVAVGAMKGGAIDYVVKSAPMLADMPRLAERVLAQWEHVTQRRRAEEALRESEEKYRLLVENQTDMIVKLDLKGRLLFVSPSYCRALGKTQDELLGARFLEPVHPEDRLGVIRALKRACKPPYWCRVEKRMLTGDDWRWQAWINTAVLDDEQKVVAVVASGRDITEQRKLQRQVLDISTEEQRRIGQELHDSLGQEMTGLAYLAGGLRRKLQERGLVEEAQTAAELANGIPQCLNQIRSVVRGLVPLEIGSEDLAPALESLAAGVAEQTGIPCVFENPAPVRVHSDDAAFHLYRIAQEAVNNAVKHASPQHIRVTLQRVGDRVELRVEDDGVGIPRTQERVNGSGLRILNYRANLIGALLRVAPSGNRGTVVTCLLDGEPDDDNP